MAFGSVAVLIGLAALIGGGVLVGIHATKRDGNGFYSSRATTMSTPTHALVSDVLDVDTDGGWLFRKGRLATLRVTAIGNQKPVFVGLAREAQVSAYLGGVSHDEVTDFDLRHFTTKRVHHRGRAAVPAPTDEHFWTAQASGTGRQAIRWPVHAGDWTVVVMNADGSPGIRANVMVGAKVPLIFWLGIALLAVGAALIAGGGLALHRGARPRPSSPGGVIAEPSEARG